MNLLGSGSVYVAPVQSPYRLELEQTRPDGSFWKLVGYVKDIELKNEPNWEGVEVDRLLDSAKLFKTSEKVTINAQFTTVDDINYSILTGKEPVMKASLPIDRVKDVLRGRRQC